MNEPATTTHPHVIQPVYQKLALIVLGLVALVYGLVQAQPIVVPLLFALLLALLLNPLVNFLTRHGLNRVVAIALAVLLAMCCATGLSYFIITQAAHFSASLPGLEEKVGALGGKLQGWVLSRTDLDAKTVDDALATAKKESMTLGGKLVGGALITMGSVFAFAFLLPVFTFLFLLYKRLLLTFIDQLFSPTQLGAVHHMLQSAKGVAQSYLIGLILQAGIVTVLNFAGLLIIGVPYALLLAVIAAVLNLIPYIGMIIATVLPMVIALATMEPSAALWVLVLYSAVQFVDNNFIVPNVVASRVELNALVSIIVVMIGGALWGIPGMFLAIPLTAVLKVAFDHVPGLKPFGYVLGSDDGTPRKPTLHARWFGKKKG